MREIVVLTFVSLDGVMQAPGGPQEDTDGGFKYGGWVFPYFDERGAALMGEQMASTRALLLGRRTYDIFASYWPAHESDSGINSATKYVVSGTRPDRPWDNTVFITGHVVQEIRKLKQQDGPDLQVHGSSQLLQTLFKHDLVDKLWLKIFPLTLGTGKRLFREGSTIPAAFRLTRSEQTPSGVIFASYERAGQVKTGSFVG